LLSPLLGLAAVLALGCSAQPQNIRLEPQVRAEPSSVGQGKKVWLQVRDSRPKKTLGVVGDLGGRYAHVSVEDDFSTQMYQSVSGALRQMGFEVHPTPVSDSRSLLVEVRDIEYQSLKQGLTYDTDTKVAIGALATNGDARYERLYTAGATKSGPMKPSASDNDKAVNETVSIALQEMLNDDRLTATLVQ
jgi:uncharacterized lipoprotein YajG